MKSIFLLRERFPDLIAKLIRRPLKVGDLVTWDKAPGKTGEIRHIDPETNEAWVRWANADNPRDYSTVRLQDLKGFPA